MTQNIHARRAAWQLYRNALRLQKLVSCSFLTSYCKNPVKPIRSLPMELQRPTFC